jgi:uncharacterized protein (DUF1778 family)
MVPDQLNFATDVRLTSDGMLPYSPCEVAMTTKDIARLEARLPASVYALLRRAAELKGRSITDFVVGAAQDAAQRVIEDEGIVRLSAEDQARFAAALLNPPKPNTALKSALRRHAKHVEVR